MTEFDLQDNITWKLVTSDKVALPEDVGDYLVVIATVKHNTLCFKRMVAYFDGTHFLDYRYTKQVEAVLKNVIAWSVLPGDVLIARCSLGVHGNILFNTL